MEKAKGVCEHVQYGEEQVGGVRGSTCISPEDELMTTTAVDVSGQHCLAPYWVLYWDYDTFNPDNRIK